jgi:hypothetical protein
MYAGVPTIAARPVMTSAAMPSSSPSPRATPAQSWRASGTSASR